MKSIDLKLPGCSFVYQTWLRLSLAQQQKVPDCVQHVWLDLEMLLDCYSFEPLFSFNDIEMRETWSKYAFRP
jgi:hypothetical protein